MTVPYVPTPRDVAIAMLRLAQVRPGEIVVDPGAGECGIIITAVTVFDAVGIGIEINPALIRSCVDGFEKLKLKGKAYVVWGDMFDFNYSIANVITLYLGSEVNKKLKDKIEHEIKPGVRVVSHDYEVPGWKPIKEEIVRGPFREHRIYLYKPMG